VNTLKTVFSGNSGGNIATGPVMFVCPYCGPQNVAFAGRVVSVPCERCKAIVKPAPTNQAGMGRCPHCGK